MILILETGSLGNQLFQYNSIQYLFPEQKCFFLGFDKVASIVELKQKIYGRKFFHSKFLFLLIYKLLILLKKIRFFDAYQELNSEPIYTYKIQKGIFGFCTIVHNAFFQHKQIFPSLISPPSINHSLLTHVSTILSSLNINSSRQKLFFIHIRRGDYLLWPSRQFPAAVSETWLLSSAEYIKSRYPDAFFLILGDDCVYNREFEKKCEHSATLQNSESVDFVLMSLCCGGILSPSTYSWWASCYARQQINSSDLFIAPKYWAGHRQGHWYPPCFYTDWLTYL